MITRKEIPAGWYGEALPSGEFAVLIPGSYIETHFGRVPLPGENVLFLRISPDMANGFQFAGQGNGTGIAWEWNQGWTSKGSTYGVSPLIYDLHDQLIFAAPKDGSQGFRYVKPDGSVATGDQTYFDPSIGLWEYTNYQGVLIGQGEFGAHVVLGRTHYLLEPGDCRFIRVDGQGSRLEVTIVKQLEQKTLLVGLDVQDIPSLPLAVASVPAPPDRPQPIPAPVPDRPHPMPQATPNYGAVVADAVNAHPALLAQYRQLAKAGDAAGWPESFQTQHSAVREKLVRYAAYAVFQKDSNFGLLRKDGGAHGTRSDGARHALAILVYRPTMALVQILSDSDPEWAPLDMNNPDNVRPPEFWLQPIPEDGPVVVPPPVDSGIPVPPTGSDPFASVRAILANYEARIQMLEARPVAVPAPPAAPVQLDGVKVALRTQNGHVVCAEDGGGSEVHSNRTDVGGWETFTLEVQK